MRANKSNLRKMKEELMRAWDLTEEEYKEFVTLAVNKTWEDYHERGNHTSFGKRDYVDAISKVIDGNGAESLYPQMEDVWYVNMGDTYATTVILDGDKLYIGCWGDIVEKNWELFEEESCV